MREHKELSNQELALAALDGDHEARNTLYLRHSRLISRRIIPAKRLASVLESRGAPITAEDVEQEAFVIFCRLLEEWQPERAPFVPFLIKRMSRAAYDYVRVFQHLRSSRAQPAERMPHGDPDQSADPGSSADGEEYGVKTTPTKGKPRPVVQPADEAVLSADAWTQMVGHLPGNLARLVHLRYREDRSSRQIAKSEGCSQRTVDRDLQFALASIHDLMQEEMEVR